MSPTQSSDSTSVKRKAPDASSAQPSSSSSVTTFVARHPPWTYLKLQLTHQPGTSPSAQSQPLDPLTARTYLTSALSQFLGLTGTSIPIDILKVTPAAPQQTPTNKTAWVRVPSDDAAAVVAALSSWIGGSTGGGSVAWRVCAKGNFLGTLVNGEGEDLFVPE